MCYLIFLQSYSVLTIDNLPTPPSRTFLRFYLFNTFYTPNILFLYLTLLRFLFFELFILYQTKHKSIISFEPIQLGQLDLVMTPNNSTFQYQLVSEFYSSIWSLDHDLVVMILHQTIFYFLNLFNVLSVFKKLQRRFRGREVVWLRPVLLVVAAWPYIGVDGGGIFILHCFILI